jgi:protein tyrosine phosphatase (PTP) superfamily phosphohydrolase (DUF442 family)
MIGSRHPASRPRRNFPTSVRWASATSVNLGLHIHEKALPDEAASVSRLGMTYIHIPVDFQNPAVEDFDNFCAVIERLKDAPVHVHCIANYRISAFIYRWRRDVLRMDEIKARAEMEAIWHSEGVWATLIGRAAASALPPGNREAAWARRAAEGATDQPPAALQ